MRILFITMQYGPGYSQGSERYITILAEQLRRGGHTVQVLAGDPDGQRSPALALGDPLPDAPAVLHYPSHGWMSIEGLGGRPLQRLLKALNPDVVHVVNPGHVGVGALVAAQRIDIPAVVTVVDYWWICPKHTLLHSEGNLCSARVPWTECLRCIALERERSWRQRLARRPRAARAVLPIAYLTRWAGRGVPVADLARWPRRQRHTLAALNRAAAIVFLSRTGSEILTPFLSNQRVFHITNGLEDWWFAGGERKRDRAADKTTLGFAGALTPHKGAHLVLQAIASIPRGAVRLRVAGEAADQTYRETLERLASGLEVEFVGRVAPQDMPAFMRSIDLLVVPSLWPENLPMVVLEAYASGTPVLGSDVAGIAEYVSDRSLLFESGSCRALARCIERYCGGDISARIPRVRTAKEMTANTVEVYELALTRRRERATTQARENSGA